MLLVKHLHLDRRHLARRAGALALRLGWLGLGVAIRAEAHRGARAADRAVHAARLLLRHRLLDDQRGQQRLDVPEGRLLDLEVRARRLAHDRVRAIDHDEAVAAELTPRRHVVLVHPCVVAVLQLQLIAKLGRELRAGATHANERGGRTEALRPRVHLLGARPAAASSGVEVHDNGSAQRHQSGEGGFVHRRPRLRIGRHHLQIVDRRRDLLGTGVRTLHGQAVTKRVALPVPSGDRPPSLPGVR
mmetsp:Transcript_833/g.2090  ORF Transcript_833/g.2090 Transcript_833/m.2090 type:complete len:245 (-) Transcript_833:9-743(-)